MGAYGQRQREEYKEGGGQRTYEKTQTREEILPTEVVFGHIAIGSETCVPWDNGEGGDRGDHCPK